ncbi:HAD family hydrolase [Streptomyces sp. N2-109]|uniref:HAD family hydrolase n=1 Tax=Streptomyces gossypii TaxID=2883101 RepID=A0ABT2JR65_9ACTN|nr:HAD family hydrolase [Streptomyces gossypii]MCT2590246.1 HAD family hydrolase [Streptomyces gossypii]
MSTPTTLIASDLDRTLIYSAGALALTMPDGEAPRLLCVEVYERRPLSYLTETAAGLLTKLSGGDGSGGTGSGGTDSRRTLFVPATTRTREQYARIRLPGPPAPYAVCANGGHLLIDGEPDTGWQAQVRRNLTDCAPLAEVRAHLLATADPAWLLKERTAEDLFAYLVVDRDRLPDAYTKELADWAEPRGWTVSLQGRKIYAVPRPLTKSAAVAEVARRVEATRTYAAGDSHLDADLLLAADAGWRPGHGELADSGWSAPHITALAERGVAAGERILREALRLTR